MIEVGLHRFTQHDVAPGTPPLVVLPHAGGSAAAFRRWVPAALDRGIDLRVVQYPGHEERFTAPRAERLEQLAEAVLTALGDDARGCVLFGHSMGGLVAHATAALAERAGTPVRRLHASGTRPPSQPPAIERRALADSALVASLGDLAPGDPNPLEDDMLASVLLPVTRHEVALAELYRAAPEPLRTPLSLHAGDADPEFAPADAGLWRPHAASEPRLHVYPGHHFYLDTQVDRVLNRIVEDLDHDAPSAPGHRDEGAPRADCRTPLGRTAVAAHSTANREETAS